MKNLAQKICLAANISLYKESTVHDNTQFYNVLFVSLLLMLSGNTFIER